jgi:small subunit ribosomal protein S9
MVKGKNDAIQATGRRKNAIAQVRLLLKGEGKVTVNKKPIDQYFKGLPHQIRDVMAPIETIEGSKAHDYVLKVLGGGITGQAGAARHAISRALVKLDEKNKKALKAAGFLTRDPRMVERKKAGQPKARKRFQYSKR